MKENPQIISDRCYFLRTIREYRRAGFQIVYSDETWVNQNHKPEFGWFPKDESVLPQVPAGKGQRFVILHAGCRTQGLLPGCNLVFKANSSEGDYHKEMNSKVFLEWWTDQLLPALNEPSVIVLDNAKVKSYTRMVVNHCRMRLGLSQSQKSFILLYLYSLNFAKTQTVILYLKRPLILFSSALNTAHSDIQCSLKFLQSSFLVQTITPSSQ